MKYYIAGPMTGYPEFNKPAFMKAEKYVREELWYLKVDVFNPAVEQEEQSLDGLTGDEPLDPEQLKRIVKKDLDGLQGCTHAYMLKGWERSVGARAEHAVAVWLGLTIEYEA